jgi:hypothetical protein
VTDPGVAAQEAIYAGLDALLSMMELDLCAYLHVPGDGGPQLFLRRPDLGHLPATEAFTLFSALRDALDRGASDVPGYNAVLIQSSGPGSRGLHAMGRREGKLDDEERRTVEALCRATASVAHALEPSENRVEPLRVAVEMDSGVVTAHVELLRNGDQIAGRAEGATAHLAVAAAALDAYGGGFAVADVAEVGVADDRAAVVLVEGAGARRVSAVLCTPGRDPLFAVAQAAIEAASRVPTLS